MLDFNTKRGYNYNVIFDLSILPPARFIRNIREVWELLARKVWLLNQRGQAIVEYTIITGLIGLALAATIANVGDQIMDIWNDLVQDLDVIDDGNADLDVVFPVSQINGTDLDGGSDNIGGGTNDNETGGYRDETGGGGGVPPI